MKILYAIQGTGNGHLSRARDIIPILQKNHDVDLLISGQQADVELPYSVKYRFKGLSFIFGVNGGIDIYKTYKRNNVRVLLKEINKLKIEDYQLVINDFEPVSAWAAKLQNIKCISLSHQSAVLNKKAPQPEDIDLIGKAILKNYAPADAKYGFHFKAFANNIYTPVIRQQIRQQRTENKGHYTVYLPAYGDKRILKVLKHSPDKRWEVFSKHTKESYSVENISIHPINNEAFIESVASAEGVLCGAGFETPAEVMFLKKKLMVIPMKGQYEQQCNAAALREMGVPVIKSLKLKHIHKINYWTKEGDVIQVDYPDNTEFIINKILTENSNIEYLKPVNESSYSLKKFRNVLLRKIVTQL